MLKKIVGFDVDGTILDRDTMIGFCLFLLKKKGLLIYYLLFLEVKI